jgi:hypothetical protein
MEARSNANVNKFNNIVTSRLSTIPFAGQDPLRPDRPPKKSNKSIRDVPIRPQTSLPFTAAKTKVVATLRLILQYIK